MSATISTRRRTAGFSLIELLVVLVILGVLASVAAPSLDRFVARQRASRALDQLAGDIAFARMQAVRGGGPTVLRAGPGGVYTVDAVSAAGDTVALRTTDLRSVAAGTRFSNSSLRLNFSSRGLVTNSSIEPVTIVTSAGRDSLLVSPAGRVYRAK